MRGATPDLGAVHAPIPFAQGEYWGTVQDLDESTTRQTVVGTCRGERRALESIVAHTNGGIYANALFAGNSSGDPTYDLTLGGVGTQADSIDGNVYSGGNIGMIGSATISGTARASGSITGTAGTTHVLLPTPDIAAMDYTHVHDIDVAAAFVSATYTNSSSYGGSAWQLPESNPAHIFRRNPSDRATDTSATDKDDYFLEDAYEPMSSSSTIDRTAGSHITLSGVGGAPGVNGNGLLYYIDGNLWVHNRNAFSFTLHSGDGTPIKVTLVVRGNIYLSDNLFYENPTTNGLAIIAIKDESVADSGNIYFGDPTFGTLEHMEAFMYAQNNFYDTNLSATGSARVTVVGNMTAGNQVRIQRDFGSAHSKLTVAFDDRLWTRALELRGLPSAIGLDPAYQIVSWREISVP